MALADRECAMHWRLIGDALRDLSLGYKQRRDVAPRLIP
jgi:hypothetical protein